MAQTLERHWRGRLEGFVVTRYGHAVPCERIGVIEAGHPVPDEGSKAGAERMLALAQGLDDQDVLLALISGGGSSLLALPAAGLSLADKQVVTRELLRSGAPIAEINCVRKHLSAIKGGRLPQPHPARELHPPSATPGDDRPRRLRARRYPIRPRSPMPPTQTRYQSPVMRPARRRRRPSCGHAQSRCRLGRDETIVPARAADALRVTMLGGRGPCDPAGRRQGEACRASSTRLAWPAPRRGLARLAFARGGETTVSVRGSGRGGRNTEHLRSPRSPSRERGAFWGSLATRWPDGSEDNAGASSPSRRVRPRDSRRTFAWRQTTPTRSCSRRRTVVTGPTLTNVNDFALYIGP